METFYAIFTAVCVVPPLLMAVMTLRSIYDVLCDIRYTQKLDHEYTRGNADRLDDICGSAKDASKRLDDMAGMANTANEYLADISVAATEANDLFVRRGMVDEWDKEKWQQEAASVSPRYKAE